MLWTERVNRLLGKEFPDTKPKLMIAGSFVSVRINDPHGTVSVQYFTQVTAKAAELIKAHGLIFLGRSNTSYHMGGCVTTWEIER